MQIVFVLPFTYMPRRYGCTALFNSVFISNSGLLVAIATRLVLIQSLTPFDDPSKSLYRTTSSFSCLTPWSDISGIWFFYKRRSNRLDYVSTRWANWISMLTRRVSVCAVETTVCLWYKMEGRKATVALCCISRLCCAMVGFDKNGNNYGLWDTGYRDVRWP